MAIIHTKICISVAYSKLLFEKTQCKYSDQSNTPDKICALIVGGYL